MRRTLIALMTLVPLAALGQATQSVVVGVNYTVNDSAGVQSDPHVSGDLVAYTNFSSPSEIRYHFLSTGADQGIPNNGAMDAVSDVFGSVIVFTRNDGTHQGIFLFDTTAGTASEIAPQPGSLRNFAAIGGSTVAWVDDGILGNTNASEIVAYDLGTATQTRLTSDDIDDRDPAVSPGGDQVAWAKCSSYLECDIYVASRGDNGWTSARLTAAAGIEERPGTDGEIVAYELLGASGDRDIAWTPVGGGTEGRVTLSGTDQNPNVAGGLIAFEHLTVAGLGQTQTDILLYDTRTGILYNLTNTSTVSERLSDIDVDLSTRLARVVYVQDAPDGENVYAFTFTVQEPSGGCEPAEDLGCADPSGRALLATVAAVRSTSAPQTFTATFSSTPGAGLLCLENGEPRATAGWVKLNGGTAVDPSAFQKGIRQVEREVTLAASNTLSARIASAPGTRYTVKVYGPLSDTCSSSAAATSASAFGVHEVGAGKVRTIRGSILEMGKASPSAQLGGDGEAAGCSSAGPATAALALLALALLLVRGRGPSPVLARRR